MSQDSNSSEESLALSEDTFSELKNLVGQDVKYITESGQPQDHQSFDPQPSCSSVDPAVFQNNVESSSAVGFHPGGSLASTYTVHTNSIPRQQQILPKPAVHQVSSPSPLMPPSLPGIPLDQDFPGPFNFDIDFEPQREPAPKAPPWTYSYKLEKLFAKRNAEIPIRLALKALPSPEILPLLSVRIRMVYSSIEHSRNVLQRCLNHASNQESSGQHIMEITNTDAVYQTCQETGQHVLTIPLKKLETGLNYKLEFIRFMCQNTCPGGPDRRPFHAVFTLLYGDRVCGVKTLKTKVCTTPGRSRENEERSGGMPRKAPATSGDNGPVPKKRAKTKAQETLVEASSSQESEMPVNQAVPGVISSNEGPIHIKQEFEGEDDELFTIQVRGRRTYEYLMKIKEAVELMDMIPPEILERYRASILPCGPTWFLQQMNQSATVSIPQPMTPNVETTTMNQDSTAVPTNTRYTLKNNLMRKKQVGSETKSVEELKEAA